jgi:rhomboid protease GluP
VTLPPRWQWKLDRLREWLSSALAPNQEPKAARLCPSCGKLVGVNYTRCHECGANLSFSLAAASRSLSRLLPAESPVTYSVLTANIILFLLSLALTFRFVRGFNLLGNISSGVLDMLGASRPGVLVTLEFWRLVTPQFLHANLLHIGFNSFVLMDIGPEVEEQYGSARYFFLYILTGMAGFLVSSWWGNFSIGASASLAGLIGLMIGVSYRRGGAVMQMLRARLVRWVVYIFILSFFLGGDHAAHTGGLVAGFLLGRYVFEDQAPLAPQERLRAIRLGWLAGAIVAASFAFMLLHFYRVSRLLSGG